MIRSNRISLVNANYSSSYAGKPSINLGPWILIDGDAQNGTYAASTTISSPTHPTGQYTVNSFSWKDVNGFTGSPTYAVSYSDRLTVTNSSTYDFTGPFIHKIAVASTTWGNVFTNSLAISNVTTDTQIITVSLKASSTSGIDLNWIRSNRITLNRVDNYYNNNALVPIDLGPWILISGSAQDGTFAASTTISSITHYTGVYYAKAFSWKDVNGIRGPNITGTYNNLCYGCGTLSLVNSSTNTDFIGPSLSNVVVSPNITGVSTLP